MTRSVLFDTETTGLEPLAGDRVIEVACLELWRDLPTGETFHAFMDPERDIPEEATRVHGMTRADLRGKPRFAQVAEGLLAFLQDSPLIAHNAPFDFGFLDAEFARIRAPALDRARMVDTLALAKAKYTFIGLPFHSIGFALAMSFAVEYNWPAFFIMWLVKGALVQYGGLTACLRFVPFFLGLGGLIAPIFWGFISWLFEWHWT